MQLHEIDIVIIIGLLLVFVFIGLRQASKNSTINDYFLGQRNLPWWLAGTSMVATTFAADTPLLVNEIVVQYGVSGNWFWWNMLAGGMLTTFFFAAYWRRANILTDVELIKIRYSGKSAEFLRRFKAVYLGVFMNALIIGWVNFALMSLVEVFFGVEDKGTQLMVVAGAMVFVYVYSGFSGYLAVVYTDFIQFILAMAGSVLMAVFVINSPEINGIDGLKAALPASSFDFFPTLGNMNLSVGLTLSVGTFLTFIAMPWWASWYPGAEPGGGGYIAQRMMSAKNEKHAVYSSMYFQIAHYCIRPWPWILVALSSIVIYGNDLDGQERMGYVWVMRDYLPVGYKGLLLLAFLAAYMSTISTQLNWGSGYLINDFIKPIFQDKSDKTLLNYSKVAVAALMCLSIFVTSFINSINEVWSFLMSCGAGLGLVLILRWYWWRINAWSEIVATIAPFVAYSICKWVLVPVLGSEWDQSIINDPRSFVFIVSFTTVSWVVVTFLTQPTNTEVLKEFYDKIKPDGNWSIFGVKNNYNRLLKLGLIWLSAIVFAYSILFLVGSLILGDMTESLMYLGFILLSALIIRITLQKVSVFE